MEKRNSDEIDVYDLLVKTVLFFRTNLWLFLSLAVVGVIASIGIGALEPPGPKAYTSKILVSSKAANFSVCSAVLMKLDNHVTAAETDSLMRDLAISNHAAASIRAFHCEGIRNSRTAPEDSIFNIVIRVHDRSSIPAVSHGLISFLQNNSFIKKESRFRQEHSKFSEPSNGIEVISTTTATIYPTVHGIKLQVISGIAGGIFAAFCFIAIRGIYRIAKNNK